MMTKTEAARIIADNIGAYVRSHDLDDSELGPLLIAEAISRMTYQTVPGSYAHRAAGIRPSDRTIRIEYRRNAGLLD